MYKRICTLAKSRNITLTELRNSLGIARNVIDRWGKGTIPRLDMATKIADYFDVSLDYLAGRIDNPEPQDTYQKLPDETIELMHIIKKLSPSKEQAKVIREYLTALSEFESK